MNLRTSARSIPNASKTPPSSLPLRRQSIPLSQRGPTLLCIPTIVFNLHSRFKRTNMKFLFLIGLVSALTSVATAFPSFQNSDSPQYAEFLKRAAEIKAGKVETAKIFKRGSNDSLETPGGGFGHRRLTALINPSNFKFNAKEQQVDLTSDKHKFIPPGDGDIRGPCPGLNLVSCDFF